jgi:hypothetical protein
MPHKPHPNGLLFYFLMTFFLDPSGVAGKLPYIIDMWPHLQVGDAPPQDVIRFFMQRWSLNEQPLLVADSGFGGFQLAEEWTNWGGKMIFSCPQDTRPELWQAMRHNVPVGNWRGAVNPSGMLIATHLQTKKEEDEDKEGTDGASIKNVISTAFNIELWDEPAVNPQ